MVQEHRYRLARDRQGIRRAGGDRRLFVVAWDAGELQFAVREPFPSKTSQTKLVLRTPRQ